MKTYSVRSTSDFQVVAADNSVAVNSPAPPSGATGMELSVVTTDVWLVVFGATPSTSLGEIVKKDVPAILKPYATRFSILPTSNAATKVNGRWLFD